MVGAATDIRFEPSVEAFLERITDLGLDHLELKHEYLCTQPDPPSPERIGELAESYGVTLSYHAPFRDWNMGSFNERSRRAGVEQVKATLEAAVAAGAGAVVVHGGSVPRRYREAVKEQAYDNAIRSLTECATYAEDVGVALCLENQPWSETTERHTTSPDDLETYLEAVDCPPEILGVTLDVGHAKVSGYEWQAFNDRFGDHIRVLHLHENDGTGDQHRPIRDYEKIVSTVDPDFAVLEMKRLDHIAESVRGARSLD
ncbi:sugar phosphate isomerase/epimerase family protein [Natronorubrum aibiense]|uniref:TIM barrel protein n=1 Tax=Natronorubrum aibiense TaxID=348826 RepID=A0A5P9P9N8_9EURY|nr:sugar phosphate isomerase/epimerase family protein [Natronorubrum aibiense]QFU84843.1 TIM barrel protein [Natronorubrum aibiense]